MRIFFFRCDFCFFLEIKCKKARSKLTKNFLRKKILNTPIFGQEKELHFLANFSYKCFINPKLRNVEIKK